VAKRSGPSRPTPRAAEARQSAAEARAEAQTRAREQRAARRAAAAEHWSAGVGGSALVQSDVVATVVFTVLSVAATVVQPDATGARRSVVSATVSFDLAMGIVGTLLFVAALVWGAGRSRTHEMTMGGWWFLTDAAPGGVKVRLFGCLAVQVVVAFATASIRPFTELAFGFLVPMFGLAVIGAWSARHGWFPERADAGANP